MRLPRVTNVTHFQPAKTLSIFVFIHAEGWRWLHMFVQNVWFWLMNSLRLLIAAQVLSCCVNICLLFSSRTSTFLVDIAVDCLAERSHEVMSGYHMFPQCSWLYTIKLPQRGFVRCVSNRFRFARTCRGTFFLHMCSTVPPLIPWTQTEQTDWMLRLVVSDV